MKKNQKTSNNIKLKSIKEMVTYIDSPLFESIISNNGNIKKLKK